MQQHQCVGKKDRVVEERLGRHQYEPEERTTSMLMGDRVPNFQPRRVRSRVNSGWRRITVAAVYDRRTPDFLFDFVDNFLRFGVSPMNHQPTRAFRNPAAKENYNEAERCFDPE